MSGCIDNPKRCHVGGVDVGGTKIEATLYDEQLSVLHRRRVKTPGQDYDEFLDTLSGEVRWIRDTSGHRNLPVGIGLPGLFDPLTGKSTTANLSATGRLLRNDLCERLGENVAMDNDCKCFALSEANQGAGAMHARVFGLIIGTGLGGALCVDGELVRGTRGLIGEVGHIALPAHLMAQRQLPLLACGCGRTGCYETLASGGGLSRLCTHLTGRSRSPEEIVAAAMSADSGCGRVFDTWLAIVGELLNTIQLCMEPDCIVLGGGLSSIPDIHRLLSVSLTNTSLPAIAPPVIDIARFGDSSGGRGAALLAIRQQEVRNPHACPCRF